MSENPAFRGRGVQGWDLLVNVEILLCEPPLKHSLNLKGLCHDIFDCNISKWLGFRIDQVESNQDKADSIIRTPEIQL